MPDRCRIVLIAPRTLDAARLKAALGGGDVASLIVPQWDLDDDAFQRWAAPLVTEAQAAGVAAILAGDTRVAGRVGADGIHLETKPDELAEAVEKHGRKMMVGAGGAKTRDDALDLGEAQPDYIFFGKFGYDNTPAPHPRNLSLGGWWAEMIEIPCIVLAGTDLETLPSVSATRVEFVALGEAVFGEGRDPAAAIARANQLLDEHAPAPLDAE